MSFFHFNGKIFHESENIAGPANRGLRYGDGLFETIKFRYGTLILGNEHFERLFNGMKQLQFDTPNHFNQSSISKNITELAARNKLTSARIRLNIFRKNGGLFDPESHLPDICIETLPLPIGTENLNSNGIDLCIFREGVKAADNFSNIKQNSFHPYTQAALFAKEKKCNDAVVLNHRGNICETATANIFIIKSGRVITPGLPEGCVAGIMRKFIIEKLAEANLTVEEKTLTEKELLNADEIFLTNSIRNIMRVQSVEGVDYISSKTERIFDLLVSKYSEIFC